MIETSSVPPRKSLAIFGKCSETFTKPSEQFWKIFGKWLEIFGKLSKTSLLVCLYIKPEAYHPDRGDMLLIKQNNTWTLGDMEFIFSCSHSISHSFAALTRSISMRTLEDKFHIAARPCIILYLYNYNSFHVTRTWETESILQAEEKTSE